MKNLDFKILIIDDNKEIRNDFIKILTSQPSHDNFKSLDEQLFSEEQKTSTFSLPSFKIDTVSQGQEGVKAIKKAYKEGRPYSLAFVDILMPPGWDGIQTIKKIWEIDKDIQIVICTAYSNYSWEETVEELGISDNLLILKKPFDNISVRQLACALTKKWQLLRQNKSYTETLEFHVKERTDSLEHTLSLIRSTLESSADGILVVSNEGKIVDYNNNFSNLWNIPENIIEQKNYKILLNHIHSLLKKPHNFTERTSNLLEGNGETSLELVKLKNGKIYEEYSQPHILNDKIVGRVWSYREVTQRVNLEQQLEYQALHDSLTGLPNRTLLHDRINQSLENSTRNKKMFSVLFFDLDCFKIINDSLSHAIGDELLKAVAKRVQKILRKSDTFGRMGGDEFVIVLPNLTSKENAYIVAQKILDALQKPFLICNRNISITASIGICTSPDDGMNADDLLANADLAMYLSKEKGGNRYHDYKQDLSQKIWARIEQEIELKTALENKEFILMYQPQINVSTNTVTGVEALIRWNHPTKGLLYPMEFLPVAEETGDIVAIGEWVIEEACRQNKEWQDMGLSPMRMVVNIESQILKKQNLLFIIKRILKETKLDPKYLEFELTETVVINDNEIVDTIHNIKKLGIKISLDDFGTGNSSISYLKNLPLDKLKIDKSFVDGIEYKGSDEIIIKAIIAIAESLNLEILAEGVERQEQLDSLTFHNCDNIQGYYFSQALPPRQLVDFLKSKTYLTKLIKNKGNYHASSH